MGPGVTFKFLHVDLTTRDITSKCGSFYDIRPTLHNELFAFGHERYPRVAKLEAFPGHNFALRSDLQPFVFARIVAFETTLGVQKSSSPFVQTHTVRSLVCLALEVLRLRWPKRWFANTLVAFPSYRRGWFTSVVRHFGKQIRHCLLLDCWGADETSFFSQV
jgi:hypothetical protein